MKKPYAKIQTMGDPEYIVQPLPVNDEDDMQTKQVRWADIFEIVQNELENGNNCSIKIIHLTDKQYAALPEL